MRLANVHGQVVCGSHSTRCSQTPQQSLGWSRTAVAIFSGPPDPAELVAEVANALQTHEPCPHDAPGFEAHVAEHPMLPQPCQRNNTSRKVASKDGRADELKPSKFKDPREGA